MCGIAGIVAGGGFDPQTLIAMTHLVSYRGPSGFGFAYLGRGEDSDLEMVHNENRMPSNQRPQIGLGSRRLAILDVSAAGNQPMAIEHGDYCMTFNGEVYNYKEIREELARLGHRFRTGTDTEVILHAYQQWGKECLQRFNGMWSFALWDRPRQTLFCARDRFGVKPFYYALSDGRFYFGSEIKQVLQASQLPHTANPRAVFHFLEWGLLDYSAETFFEGVQQLQGGCFLRLRLADPLVPDVQRYWELRIEPKQRWNERDATDEFRDRFENAVKLRLRSDVPVGVCLSGGLDSSAIACQAKKLSPDVQFQTFSACFDEASIDEREYIAAVVDAAKCAGHSTFPGGTHFWEEFDKVTYHHDEPVGSTGAFAQWCVMAEAHKRQTPVVLGGQGGDEILCGYQKYRYFYLWHLLKHADPRFLREAALWARNGTRGYWMISSASRYFPSLLRRTFSLTEDLGTAEFRNQVRGLPSELGAGDSIAERQKTDLIYSSIPALLHAEDRNSMAHSVESRLPFLDYRLAEFAVNCAPSLKLRDGWSKWLLREALVGVLPEKIRLRKTKLGFNTPEADWMRQGLQNGHRDLWEVPRLRMERFLDARKLARECEKFLRAAPGALPANWLFRAVSLESWGRVLSAS